MDLSSNFVSSMRRISSPTNVSRISGCLQDPMNCPMEIHFKITRDGAEVPLMNFDEVQDLLLSTAPTLREDEYVEVIVPLCLEDGTRQCSGGDTIIKYFANRWGRMNKVVTPKGEEYYGGNGFVLDKDFKPLFYVTKKLEITSRNPAGGVISFTSETYAHFSPQVFINDTGVLNKTLAKKGVVFFLTENLAFWGEEEVKAKVVIDDGSSLFKNPIKPSPRDNINAEARHILRKNIADVLKQIREDARYF